MTDTEPAGSVFAFPVPDSTSAWTADFRLVPREGRFGDAEAVRKRAQSAAAGNRLYGQSGVVVVDAGLLFTGLRLAASRATAEPDGSVLLETWTEASGEAFLDGPGYHAVPAETLLGISRMPAARDLADLLNFEGYGPLDVVVLGAADCPGMPEWVAEAIAAGSAGEKTD